MEYSTSQDIKGEQTTFKGPSLNPQETHSEALSPDVFLLGAAFSIGTSLVLRLLGQREDAQFVGQWAPTLLVAGLYTRGESRLLKTLRGKSADVEPSARQVM
jgi:hypothetical protein